MEDQLALKLPWQRIATMLTSFSKPSGTSQPSAPVRDCFEGEFEEKVWQAGGVVYAINVEERLRWH
jgi:hypothetical protein